MSETGIVQRLRDYDNCDDSVIDEAADMLEQLLDQFQMHSPDMGGQHRYRFRNGGWPMNHMRGPNCESALMAVLAEVARERKATQ